MNILYVLLLVLKIYSIYHVIKNDKSVIWIVVIIVIPGSSIFYLLFQILLNSDLSALKTEIKAAVNPNSRIEELEKQFKHSDNFQNKMALADAYLAIGRKQEALELYETSLNGVFKDDVHFLLQLGLCYFELKDFRNAAFTLLKVKNTVEFRRTKYHLAYALSLDSLGKNEMALEQFEKMNSEKGNFEYRHHYHQFLAENGEKQKAISMIEKMLDELTNLDTRQKNALKIWLEKSKALLHELQY